MKFGKVDSVNELNSRTWELPHTSIEFQKLSNPDKIEISSGGTMWTIKPWRGLVYPQKDPMRTWPEHYGNQFGTIEFNATHYRIYSPEKMKEWADKMPDGFKFCPKFPAIISHYRRFNNCEGPTDDFIEGLLALGSKLGPAFLQLPPHFAPKHSSKLIDYLKSWPRELKIAVEFRHPLWFDGGNDAEEVWSLLSELGIGAVISDTVGRPDALHMRITAPFLIVRFGGYDGHKSDEVRIKEWARWIVGNASAGIESFHFLVHQTDSVHTPYTCVQFADIINETCNLEVKAPIFRGTSYTSSQNHMDKES